MQWFRSNIKGSARLALFALAVQFALSFGHVHWFAAAAQAANGTPGSASSGIAQVLADDYATLNAHVPAGPDREQQPADGCAICAVMAIAGSLLLSSPPTLPVPQILALGLAIVCDRFAIAEVGGLAFQARAPPLT